MIAASPPDTAARLGLDVNGIMWTDATINPGLYGCAKVSPACTNCYAEAMAARIVRMGTGARGMTDTAARYGSGLTDDGRWTGRVVWDGAAIEPAFDKLPKKAGTKIRRVFCTSMSDPFHKDVPDEFICKMLAEMRARPWITFQVLTKRAERLAAFADGYGWGWPPNVWIGCTVEDQRRADERIPYLLRVPAAVRFLSVEPMLGRIDLMRWIDRLHWAIIGSESDGPRPGKRKTDPAWVLDLVAQCDAAGVPVFVKQAEVDGRLVTLPLVNGKVRAEFPEVTP